MNSQTVEHAATGPTGWLVAAVLAISIAAVYGRALDAPFIFDDVAAVVRNTSIQSLWPPIGNAEHPGPLNPARDQPTAARPLVNLSFALNYHFDQVNPVGYRALNLLIHFSSAFLLWLVVRATLRLPRLAGRFESSAGWLAFAAAFLWSLHPLQTEAVIYITQRTELMMTWCYLATIYCSLRYWSANTLHTQRLIWLTLAGLACLAGMASKEVMVSAPLMILLVDRTFVSGSFARALRESWPLYIVLASTWIVLLALNLGSPRGASAGFHADVPLYVWWLTQCKVLLLYLKLAIWPSPLLWHYQLPYVRTLAEALVYVLPVLILAVVALVLLWRNSPVGFLLTFIAAILAPTSIVPIMSEMGAERRMYLPLAALSVLFVVSVYRLVERLEQGARVGQPSSGSHAPLSAMIVSIPILALVYGVASAKRLPDYYNETLMWQQVVQAQPNNYLAHYNLGLFYNYAGREEESFAELQTAVVAKPDYPNARSAFGFALINAGRLPEAVESLQAALAIDPDHVAALNNMGIALTKMGRYAEAIKHLQHALQIDPTHAPAHNNLGKALANSGQTAEAIKELQTAQSLAPEDPDMLNDLATALTSNNQAPQAIEVLEHAVKARPDFAAAHNSLGIALYRAGNKSGAVAHFRRFLELRPTDPGAYFNLANVVAEQGDFKQAASLYEHAVTLRPDSPEAHVSLASALAHIGEHREAIDHFQKALELNPNMLAAYAALADTLASANRGEEAVKVAQRGIEAAHSMGDQTTASQLQDWLKRAQSAPPRK